MTWNFPRPGQDDVVVDVRLRGLDDPTDLSNAAFEVNHPELGAFSEATPQALCAAIQAAIDSAGTLIWEPRIAFGVLQEGDNYMTALLVNHIAYERSTVDGKPIVRVGGSVEEGVIDDRMPNVTVVDVEDTPAHRNRIRAAVDRVRAAQSQLEALVRGT